MSVLACFREAATSCQPALYIKHPARRNTKAADTEHGPARYFPKTRRKEIEQETVRVGRQVSGDASKGQKTVYLREVGSPIGWDRGVVATWSYVECSNGVSPSTRNFHGRPMSAENPILAKLLAKLE